MDRIMDTQLELYNTIWFTQFRNFCFIYLVQATKFSSITLCVGMAVRFADY